MRVAAGALGLAALQLAATTTALELVESLSPAVVSHSVQRRELATFPQHRDRLRKRAGTVSVPLDNELTLYFANATLGTPPQQLRLHLDTGSSDLWCNAANSTLCTQHSSICAMAGTFSPGNSSTAQLVNHRFNISYVDGTGASGDYITDTLAIGSIALTGFQFGIGYVSTSTEGILGIGYAVNEVQVNRAGLQPYPNLPAALVNGGLINSNAYSLWLNDLDASTGTILFGGVDTAKYNGNLATLPIIAEQGIYREFVIALTAVGTNGNEGSVVNNQAVPVLLDSGSSLTYLPNSITQSIYSAVNAEYDASQGAAVVDCSLGDQQGSIDFTFSGVTISVPYNEMVLVGGYNSQGGPICIIGLAPVGKGTSVLGDTFLRSAYVVYDLANNEISLAQTNFNATATSVQEIGTGKDSVPGASAVPNAVSSISSLQSSNVFSGGSNGGVSGSFGSSAAASLHTPVVLQFLGAALAASLGMMIL